MVFDLFLCLLKGRIRLPIKTQELSVQRHKKAPLKGLGRVVCEVRPNGSP